MLSLFLFHKTGVLTVCGVGFAQKAAVEMARSQGWMGRKVSIFDAQRKQTMKPEAPVFLLSYSHNIVETKI